MVNLGNTMAVADSDRPIKILLVGKTGSGKSTTGNAILSVNYNVVKKYFGEAHNVQSGYTQDGEQFDMSYLDQTFTIIDTPGVLNVTDNKVTIDEEICNIIRESDGVDAIVYVIKAFHLGLDLDDDELMVMETLLGIFGEKFWDHAIFLFTHGFQYHQKMESKKYTSRTDDIPEITFQQFLNKNAIAVNKYKPGRYVKKARGAVLFENNERDNSKLKAMVKELMDKVIETRNANNCRKYTKEFLNEVPKDEIIEEKKKDSVPSNICYRFTGLIGVVLSVFIAVIFAIIINSEVFGPTGQEKLNNSAV